jgi:hypothetical protein
MEPSWACSGVAVLAPVYAPSLRTPFDHAVLQALRAEPLSTQEIHRIERHHAVRPAAICNDIVALAQIAETFGKIRERHGDRARDVTGDVLFARSHVNHGDFASANPPDELLVVDGLERAAPFQVLPRDLLNLGQARFRQLPQFQKEVAHLRVRETVGHVQPGLLAVDKTCTTQHLQMMRGRRDTLTSLLGERFDRAWSLRQEVEQFETARAGGRLTDASDLFVDRGFQ